MAKESIVDNEDGASQPRGIQSLDNTGQLLDALLLQARAVSLAELAKAAEMAPAKAFPHLVSLQKVGLVARDGSGNYLPGTLAVELGLLALQRLSPTVEAEPEVIALAQATGLSVALAVAGPLGPTVIRLEEAALPQHVSLRVGTVLSMVNTAIGRVCAANLPSDVMQAALAQDAIRMEGAANHTALRRNGTLEPAYAQRLEAVRAGGMDQALSWPVPGINTLAAPVFNHSGELAVVLAVMGSSGSFDTAPEGETARLLLQSTQRLSWRFGAAVLG